MEFHVAAMCIVILFPAVVGLYDHSVRSRGNIARGPDRRMEGAGDMMEQRV
jgi:hypothetical protein